jgi:uncharacterized membrane protein
MIRKAIPAVALMAAACGGADQPAPAAAPPAPPAAEPAAAPPAPTAPGSVVRGIAIFSPTMSFRPCFGPIATLLDSTSNRLRPMIGLVGSSEQQGIFVIGVGETSSRNEMILREVDYAVRPAPGEGCERPEQEYTIGVRGVDSTWQITLAPGGIEYRDAAGSQSIRLPAASPVEAGGIATYSSTAEFGEPHTLRIVLTPGSCRETRSGAWSPFRASVTLDGKTVQGCAWRGILR